MSTTTPAKSHRLQMSPAEQDGTQFTMTHNASRSLRNSRRFPDYVEVGFQRPAMDEVPEVVSVAAWQYIKADAARHGCTTVGDNLSPAEAVAMANALRAAVLAERQSAMKDALRKVIKVCEQGLGLRTV